MFGTVMQEGATPMCVTLYLLLSAKNSYAVIK